MSRVSDPRKNASGCWDFTAYDAIKNVEEKRMDSEEYRFHKLINSIFKICDKAGYRVHGRIVLQNKKTGKIHR